MKFLATLFFSIVFYMPLLPAQVDEGPLQQIKSSLLEEGYTPQDLAELTISDQYTDRHNGVTHIYYIQQHLDIPIFNALLTANVDAEGRVFHLGNRLHLRVAEKINAAVPAISAKTAISAAALHLSLPHTQAGKLLEKAGLYHLRFEGGQVSRSPISAQLCYQPMPDGRLYLAWNLSIQPFEGSDFWSLRVDALTGAILHQNNWTISCRFEKGAFAQHNHACSTESHNSVLPESRTANREPRTVPHRSLERRRAPFTGPIYNVFPFPVESPAHGDRELLTNPSLPEASPFGWHDTDGLAGAEYTITRGNNVHAYADLDADYDPPLEETDGGMDLHFDFPFFPDSLPEYNTDAANTNHFYVANYMHDMLYQYGFTEEAGNFQANNYGNGGQEEDYVRALGQFGGEDPEGNGALNNANFTTMPDGTKPIMRMFYWNVGSRLLEITAPTEIEGLYNAGTAEFGPTVADQPVSGEIVEVLDPEANPSFTDGCETPFVNEADLVGKIALIDRGLCLFKEKVKNAEDAGAIAVIICNFQDGVVTLGDNASVPPTSIPAISISKPDCDLIRQFLESGVTANIQEPEADGPAFLTSDFDNGVIAHEYAHGLSNRLTGGPGNTGCLSAPSQMGEGWSDFFALAPTVEAGDTGEMPRGVATYLVREPNNGKGIRTYPYSTDMDINPLTFSDVISENDDNLKYRLGSVWTSMIWDLYWAMVEAYGWDSDPVNGNGGNNMAVQLVIDGMKMQPCDPDFVDARDAILAADEILYGGANQCLIWEVFARRGLGYFADQGLFYEHRDGKEDFSVYPPCIEELKISKEVTPFIEYGETIDVTLRVVNHKPGTATEVVVTDEWHPDLTYIAGSASQQADINGSTISFELGELTPNEEIEITYQLRADDQTHSLQIFYEDFEGGIAGIWGTNFIGEEQPNEWELTTLFSYSGERSFFVENITQESQQVLQSFLPITIEGDQPVLRFFHRYDTEPATDGGFVEVSTDIGNTWTDLGDRFFREPYDSPIGYSTFAIPEQEAFSGNSNGWIASYADLSDFIGEDIYLRFRFGTNDEVGFFGWFVDDVEIMDLIHYNSEACVNSSQGDLACADAAERGTLLDTTLPSSVTEETKDFQVAVFPNPATRQVNIRFGQSLPDAGQLELITVDGKVVLQQALAAGLPVVQVGLAGITPGWYALRITSGEKVFTSKLLLR